MHFSTVVILPEGSDFDEEAIARLLAPYDENGEWFKDGSRWDWWMVGGRWDGELLGLPWLVKKEPCTFCNATGVSPYATLKEDGTYHHAFIGGHETDYPYGCHVCEGTAITDAWATNDAYSTPERNSCKGADVATGFIPAVFVSPDGEWHEQSRAHWFGNFLENEQGHPPMSADVWEKEWNEAKQQYASHMFVMVDCHV